MDTHKEHMTSFIQNLVSSKSSPVITQEKYAAIVDHLKTPTGEVTAKFKHWVKSKAFQLMPSPTALGIELFHMVSYKNLKGGKMSFFSQGAKLMGAKYISRFSSNCRSDAVMDRKWFLVIGWGFGVFGDPNRIRSC